VISIVPAQMHSLDNEFDDDSEMIEEKRERHSATRKLLPASEGIQFGHANEANAVIRKLTTIIIWTCITRTE